MKGVLWGYVVFEFLICVLCVVMAYLLTPNPLLVVVWGVIAAFAAIAGVNLAFGNVRLSRSSKALKRQLED